MKKTILDCSILICFLTGCTSNYAEDKEATLMLWHIDNKSIERTGSYTGDLEDGLPSGVGVFSAVNDEKSTYNYESEFLNG